MKKILFILGVMVGLFLLLGSTAKGATILFPSGGGTGTSTAPTYGKVLVGNAGGTYTLTATSSLGITSSSGGSGTVSTSTNETAGFLSYWTSNSATPALLGKVATGTILGAGGVTVTAAQSVIGSGLTITCSAASGSVTGCLSSTDWTTFNNKQAAGTYVTSLTVASTNGFAGSSSGGATPALTLSTTITGLLKGNGTAISAASNGTDFSLISALTCSAGQFFQQATAAGVFTCGTPAGSTFPFTPTNNFGINTNATSTTLSLFAGLNASSTSRIASSTFDVTGFVGIGTSTNDVAGSKFALAVSNSVASLGGLLISTWTNVTNAFRIVNAAGATVFNVDTTAANPFLGIGTTTPWGTLSAVGNGTNPIFAVASSSNTGLPNFMIDSKGYIVTSGAPPVTSACGTSPVISGNDTDWRVHIGSTLASSCTITFSQSRGTATNPPICVITQETGAALAVVASTTPTAVVISGGTFTSDWFTGHCEAYQ